MVLWKRFISSWSDRDTGGGVFGSWVEHKTGGKFHRMFYWTEECKLQMKGNARERYQKALVLRKCRSIHDSVCDRMQLWIINISRTALDASLCCIRTRVGDEQLKVDSLDSFDQILLLLSNDCEKHWSDESLWAEEDVGDEWNKPSCMLESLLETARHSCRLLRFPFGQMQLLRGSPC